MLHTAFRIWGNLLRNPVTITFSLSLSPDVDSANVLAQTSSVLLQTGYSSIKGTIEEHVGFSFPENPTFAFPPNYEYNQTVIHAKSAFKALGADGIDEAFGELDGSIVFNSNFDFDFNLTDGISENSVNFLAVIVHELGHLLGFSSLVDDVDFIESQSQGNHPVISLPVGLLDLYRFSPDTLPGGTMDQNTFLEAAREMRPTIDNHFLADPASTFNAPFSTGVQTGDGNQASHWKDDQLLGGIFIGIMDPVISQSSWEGTTPTDFRAFNRIGWEINPLPAPVIVALFPPNIFEPPRSLQIVAFLLTPSTRCGYFSSDPSQFVLAQALLFAESWNWVVCEIPETSFPIVSVALTNDDGQNFSNNLGLRI